MKKLLVFAITLLLSFQSFAQDPDLYGTWYLNSYFIDPSGYQDVREILPPIFPTLTITESLEFSGLAACNTFTGSFEYSNDSDTEYLTTTSFFPTDETCDSTEQDLSEFSYFELFNMSTVSPVYFFIDEDEYGVKHLQIHHPLLSLWNFSSVPLLPSPEIYNTWYLSEMVDIGENTLVADIDPPISPAMVINADLSFTGESACNDYMGDFMYHEEGDFFTIHNFDATLALCDYDSHDDFDSQFFSYFGVNADVQYYFGGNFENQILTLEFATGYELIFQNAPILSGIDHELALFSMYPNPATNQLFITSENHEIEKVRVYSISGTIIQEIENFTTSIDVSHLAEGVYFIEVSTSEGKSVQKFIKH